MMNSSTLRKADFSLSGASRKSWNRETSIFKDETSSGRDVRLLRSL